MANKLGDTGRVRTGFLKSGKPSSSQKVGVDSCKLNEKSKMAKSNKIEKKKLSTESVFRFSSVDPIIFWSAVVLIIASISVIGATVFNVGGGRDAAYGDSVNVDYTGSYYDYCDKDGARVFDHSRSEKIEIDNSNKNKYPFACALIGHHPGEVIRLCIKNECSSLHTEKIRNDFKIKDTDIFNMSDYKLFFGLDAPSGVGIYDGVDSPYGWPARVIVNADDRVIVKYKPDVNERYSIKGSSAETEVTGITADSINFKYKIVFPERDRCENEKERDTVRIALDGRPIYAVDVEDDSVIYKNNEKAGANLYYIVKFVSFASRD